ncbi:MAG: hypothetical protein HC925_09775 [Coleofasciculaceae cyanobacterium SM2_3_26]|nr:hypothetical protein [Coleofasciculaceae cyanobacterium SM2_3_26]
MKCDRCSRWSVACLSSLLLLIGSATLCPEALAESRRVDFLMNADRTVSFTLLVQQAEEFARKVIVREFRTNPQLTELTVVVIGERNGARAAVVQATVTRSEWESAIAPTGWNSPCLPDSTRICRLHSPHCIDGGRTPARSSYRSTGTRPTGATWIPG